MVVVKQILNFLFKILDGHQRAQKQEKIRLASCTVRRVLVNKKNREEGAY